MDDMKDEQGLNSFLTEYISDIHKRMQTSLT